MDASSIILLNYELVITLMYLYVCYGIIGKPVATLTALALFNLQMTFW